MDKRCKCALPLFSLAVCILLGEKRLLHHLQLSLLVADAAPGPARRLSDHMLQLVQSVTLRGHTPAALLVQKICVFHFHSLVADLVTIMAG